MRVSRLRHLTASFAGDRRGFAAVEFALILPVLLLFALGVTEVGRFVLLGLKVQHAADTIADLASGTSQLAAPRLTDMFQAVKHVVAPFDVATQGVAIVSGVAAAGGGPATVLWQRRGAGPRTDASTVGAQGGNAHLPTGLTLRDGESVIVAELYFRYPGSMLNLIPATTIHRLAVYRPRFGMPSSL